MDRGLSKPFKAMELVPNVAKNDVYVRDEDGELKRLHAIRDPVGQGRQLVLQVNRSEAEVAHCQMVACSRSPDKRRVDELKFAVPDFASTRGSWKTLPSSWSCLEVKAIADQRRHEGQRPAGGWMSRPSQWFCGKTDHERQALCWFSYSDGRRKWGSREVQDLFTTCRALTGAPCTKEVKAYITRPMKTQHHPPQELQLPDKHELDRMAQETIGTSVDGCSNTICDLPTELLELIVDYVMDGREGLLTVTEQDYEDWDEPNFEFRMARPAIFCVNRRLNKIANGIRRRRNGKVIISSSHWLRGTISRRRILSAASGRLIQFATALHMHVNELCPPTNNPTVTQLAQICRLVTPPFRIIVSFESDVFEHIWPAAVWAMYVSELLQPLQEVVHTTGNEMTIEDPDVVDADYDQFALQQGVLLEQAAEIGSLAIVQHLLREMEVLQADVSFQSTVVSASVRGNYEVVRELLVKRQVYGALSRYTLDEIDILGIYDNAYDGKHKRIEDLLINEFRVRG